MESYSRSEADGVQAANKPIDSVFRTPAWIEAWLETYGSLPGVEIIDPLGSGRVEELFYLFPAKALKVLPTKIMGLAGCQAPGFSSPRAEYNLPLSLLDDKGLLPGILSELKKCGWSRLYLPDVQLADRYFDEKFLQHQQVNSTAYHVDAVSCDAYLATLGKNTRSRFFNKFTRLISDYSVEFVRMGADEFDAFGRVLNEFHRVRWGSPCYSDLSIRMFQQFTQQLVVQGGSVTLELMNIAGKTESVLFDVEWKGRRYNFQAGYNESFSSQLKLGSLHIGKAIREAIEQGLVYDMMAGKGKIADYKSSLSNVQTGLANLDVYRGVSSVERWIKLTKNKLLRGSAA